MSTGRGYDHLPEHRRRIYQGDRCTDFDQLIAEASSHGKPVSVTCWPDGRPITDEQDAWDLINKIRNSRPGRKWTIRRGQPDGLGPQQAGDGTWTARLQFLPKDQGREYITAQLDAGNLIPFNPARRKASGKYICRKDRGGCGHRRAAQPETLCAGCAVTAAERQAAEFTAGQRKELQQLAQRSWGEDWESKPNYLADHALIPPRVPREEADLRTSARARQNIPLEERLRQRAGAQLPWEEERPRPQRRTIGMRTRQARQSLADQAEAAQLGDDPAAEYVRKLVDEVKAGHWSY